MGRGADLSTWSASVCYNGLLMDLGAECMEVVILGKFLKSCMNDLCTLLLSMSCSIKVYSFILYPDNGMLFCTKKLSFM